jgi:hypothetical protein
MKPLVFASTIVSLALLAIFGLFHRARPKATAEWGDAKPRHNYQVLHTLVSNHTNSYQNVI